jgi:thioredoxin reductase (NADPH)
MTQPLAETPDINGTFPRLDDDQIRVLAEWGERRATGRRDILVREGDRNRDFFVVMAGMVAVVEGLGTESERVVRVHGPRRFLDEIGLLTGQPSFVSLVVYEEGEVLAVPLPAVRDVVARDPKLGNLILCAYVTRRELLVGSITGMRIIGSRFSPDTRRLREFAARNRLPTTWIDLEEDPGADELLRQFDVGRDETPVVILRDAKVLRNPSVAVLARVLGLPVPSSPDGLFDLVVVGAGPAGLAASVYGASEGLRTVVLDAVATGGQAGTSSRIENYLGFPAGISGAELADRAVVQAEKFGATLSVPARATALDRRDGLQVVRLEDGTELPSRTVILATGARYRKLDVPRLEEFEGTSVYYAATYMEAGLCAHRQVVVIGGGNSAGQAALYLARYACNLRLLIRHDDLGRDMSRYLVDQIERHPEIEVRRDTEVRELVGREGELEAILVQDTRTGACDRLPADLVFVFIGAQPCTDWLHGTVALDERGYVRTGPDAVGVTGGDTAQRGEHPPQLLESSRPGVLAVGDVRSGSTKRVASAVGEGSMAVRLVHEHLSRTGQPAGPSVP